jgi:hypothetical protein
MDYIAMASKYQYRSSVIVQKQVIAQKKWAKSNGKELLIEDLLQGYIPINGERSYALAI